MGESTGLVGMRTSFHISPRHVQLFFYLTYHMLPKLCDGCVVEDFYFLPKALCSFAVELHVASRRRGQGGEEEDKRRKEQAQKDLHKDNNSKNAVNNVFLKWEPLAIVLST